MVAAFSAQASFVKAGTLGDIRGVVTDANTGQPIAGVRLQISAPSDKITVTTDAHGHYVAFSLPPDDYTLTAVKAGYDTETFGTYSVYADQTQVYDLKLHPSST